MPAYDFECEGCGDCFEERHVITAIPDSARCVKCGATAHRKMGTGGTSGLVTPDWKAYSSIRLPKNLKVKGLKNDAAGRPQIMTRQLEERVLKETGYLRE